VRLRFYFLVFIVLFSYLFCLQTFVICCINNHPPPHTHIPTHNSVTKCKEL
uniref:Uncharacterized protein n=1 Tax=Xenopus tropicalis TaxID=8364 RepID=A0A6I8RNL4_XENTR